MESTVGSDFRLRGHRGGQEFMGALLGINRTSEGGSLQVDEMKRVVAVCDLPGDVPGGEVLPAVRRIAATADRWEALWTGGDVN